MSAFRTALVVGAYGAALLVGGALIERGVAGPRRPRVAGERVFERLVELVEHNYIDSVAPDTLLRSAVEGMFRGLGDPHSSYLPPRRLDRLAESTTGNYVGIGVEIDMRDAGIAVVAPLPGSPAEAAGITTGDLITHVNGTPTSGWTIEEARGAIRGVPGTTVAIGVTRPGVAAPIPFELTRREVHRQAIRRAVLLAERIGYVDVDVFSGATAAELTAAVDGLRARGARSLVLDLRSNPGGLLEQGVAATDLFLDPGLRIVEMRGRIEQANQVFRDTRSQPWSSMPVVVLVNEGSASASEILAGALQDHDRAVIVGQPTFGKGSAQSLVRLPDGGAVRVTTAIWYTPSGRSINRATGTDDRDSLDLFASALEVTEAPTFRTDAGRTVFGGGGIVPDVRVERATLPEAEVAFRRRLGAQQARYTDALTEYGLALRGSRAIASTDFTVTSAMLDDLWERMRRRGITIDRVVYDRASGVVSRQLGNVIARYVFGPDAEFLRQARHDPEVAAAIRLVAGASTQADVFARVESRGERGIAERPTPR
jgi:carboxyl-terminal processing protease